MAATSIVVLAGVNARAQGIDFTKTEINTAIDSGMDKSVSDDVASISYSPNRTYTFATCTRFYEATGSASRLEAEGRANSTAGVLNGDYAGTAESGLPNLPRRHPHLRLGQYRCQLGDDRL